MRVIIILLLLLIASAVMAGEISDYKTFWLGEHIYDDRTFSRNLTATVPESGDAFRVSCWWGQSWFMVRCPDTENRFYLRDDGNFEWEFILTEPGSDNWTFRVNSDSLKFLYQPPAEGRPDSVVGSYAVYTTLGWGNIYYEDGYREIYKTGKAFHIYRPKAIDANGDWIYGNQRIENGVWEIWFDSEWMKSAAYPVVVDPTFGSTSDGASTQNTVNYIYGMSCPASDIASSGTLDSIGARVSHNDGTLAYHRMIIYNFDTGDSLATDLVAQTDSFGHCTNFGYFWVADSTDCGTDPADGDGISISGSITASTPYVIAWVSSTGDAVNSVVRFDSDNDYCSYRELNTSNWPTPDDPSEMVKLTEGQKFSFYAVYTVSASSSPQIIRIGGLE